MRLQSQCCCGCPLPFFLNLHPQKGWVQISCLLSAVSEGCCLTDWASHPVGRLGFGLPFICCLYFQRALLKQIPYPSSPQKYSYFLFVLSLPSQVIYFCYFFILSTERYQVNFVLFYFSIGKQQVPQNCKPCSSLAVKQRERPYSPSEKLTAGQTWKGGLRGQCSAGSVLALL